MVIFSKRLRELRTEAGFTQRQVADYLGIRQQYYAQYESCISEPSLETLVKIADLFKVSADYILGITDGY